MGALRAIYNPNPKDARIYFDTAADWKALRAVVDIIPRGVMGKHEKAAFAKGGLLHTRE